MSVGIKCSYRLSLELRQRERGFAGGFLSRTKTELKRFRPQKRKELHHRIGKTLGMGTDSERRRGGLEPRSKHGTSKD